MRTSLVLLVLAMLLAMCCGGEAAGCPTSCPSFKSPVCAKGDNVGPMTFDNSCKMGMYTCKNNVRMRVIKNGEC